MAAEHDSQLGARDGVGTTVGGVGWIDGGTVRVANGKFTVRIEDDAKKAFGVAVEAEGLREEVAEAVVRMIEQGLRVPEVDELNGDGGDVLQGRELTIGDVCECLGIES